MRWAWSVKRGSITLGYTASASNDPTVNARSDALGTPPTIPASSKLSPAAATASSPPSKHRRRNDPPRRHRRQHRIPKVRKTRLRKTPIRRWKTPGLLVCARRAALLVLLGALYLVHRKDKAGQAAEPDNQDVRVSPLTALPGYVGWPALSPDGKQVVFAWDGGRNAAKSMFDLYIKVIGAERIEQLTHQPSRSDHSRLVSGRQHHCFYSIEWTGERHLHDVRARRSRAKARRLHGRSLRHAGSLSWSADGRQLVYEAKDDLRLLTVETGETRTIERPQQCKRGILCPSSHRMGNGLRSYAIRPAELSISIASPRRVNGLRTCIRLSINHAASPGRAIASVLSSLIMADFSRSVRTEVSRADCLLPKPL